MPKTRKSRKKKTNNQTTGEAGKTRSGADSDSDSDSDTVSKSGDESAETKSKTETELKSDLKDELERLQNEYMRQKLITEELERERDKLGGMVVEDLEVTSASSAVATEQPPKMQQYPEVEPLEHAPSFDEEYLSEPRMDRELMESISSLENELGEIKIKLDTKLDKSAISELDVFETMNRELTNKITNLDKEVEQMRKEVEKTDQKLSDILLDLGFEENIDINKIPHTILVLVYETILDDIIAIVRRTKGIHDTEVTVNNILENVRSHTSGGELFKYEHNKITIPQLRQYLAKKLISPKQIHITYNSILQQLLEHAPGYSPKNFKAMIKVLSQEYAVDATSRLEEQLGSYNTEIEELKENINKFFAKYKDRAMSQQFHKDELKNVNIHISKITERIENLPEIVNNLVNRIVDERVRQLGEPAGMVEPEKTVDKIDDKTDEKDIDLDAEPEFDGNKEGEAATIESEPEPKLESEPEHKPEPEPKPKSEPQTEGVFGGSGTIVLGDDESQEDIKNEGPAASWESSIEELKQEKSEDTTSALKKQDSEEQDEAIDDKLDMESIKEKIAEMVKQKEKPQKKDETIDAPIEEKQPEKGKFQSIVIDDESLKPLDEEETKPKEKKQKPDIKKGKEKGKEKGKSKNKPDDKDLSDPE